LSIGDVDKTRRPGLFLFFLPVFHIFVYDKIEHWLLFTHARGLI